MKHKIFVTIRKDKNDPKQENDFAIESKIRPPAHGSMNKNLNGFYIKRN